jgi:branched-chain amino acid transport system substrate-binding protein
MHKKRKWKIVSAVLVTGAVALAAGCGSSGGTSNAGGAQTILLGHDAELSGLAEQQGIPYQAGLVAGLAEINQAQPLGSKYTFKMITKDNGSSIGTAAQIYSEFQSQGAVATFESGFTPIGAALLPLANKAKLPIISGGGGLPFNAAGKPIGQDGYFFSMLATYGPQQAVGEYLVKNLHATRVGLVIDSTDAGFEDLALPVEHGLQVEGLKGYVTTQEVPETETDYSSVLANLRQANVNAVVIMLLADAAGNFLLQAKATPGFENVVYAGHQAISGETSKIAGKDAVGLVFPQAWISGNQPAALAFQKAQGVQPSSYFAYGHDAAWLFAAAAKILVGEGKQITGPNIQAVLPAASQSPLFKQNAYIQGFTMTRGGYAVWNGQLATFNSSGQVVPAN